MNKWKLILKKEKLKERLRFDWAEILKIQTNAKYFCVNISTPPFHLKLWDEKF